MSIRFSSLLPLLCLLGMFFLPASLAGGEGEAEESWEGQWLQHMEESRHAAFVCDLREKELLEAFHGESGRYAQLGLPSGDVLRKMEFFPRGKEPHCVFLELPQGVYGSFDGHWFALEDFPLLRHFPRMWEPMPAQELSLGRWTRKETTYQNRKTWRYQFSVTQEGKALEQFREMPLFSYSRKELEDVHCGFYQNRPFFYLFLVDQKTGLVLARTEMDLRGRELSRKVLAGLDFATKGVVVSDFRAGEVENPGMPCTLEEFLGKYEEYRRNLRPHRWTNPWKLWWGRFRRSPLGGAGGFLGICALFFLGGALWLGHRKGKEGK